MPRVAWLLAGTLSASAGFASTYQGGSGMSEVICAMDRLAVRGCQDAEAYAASLG
jgi:hypothetical protein